MRTKLLALPLVALGAHLLAPAPARALDPSLYAALLARHTREVADPAGTRVDYRALASSAEWRRLVAGLAGVEPDALPSREARMAFWINAYNILAIDLVVRNQPLESIRDIGSFFSPVWNREAGRIGGRAYSLGEIEHEILRPLGDPRIHVAIVCASTSCPALRREPFRAGRLDAQLDDSLRRFLASPEKGLRLDRGARTLHLSRIFDWFEEDFEAQGGVLAYLLPFFDPETRHFVEGSGGALEIAYLDYDWSLNGL